MPEARPVTVSLALSMRHATSIVLGRRSIRSIIWTVEGLPLSWLELA